MLFSIWTYNLSNDVLIKQLLIQCKCCRTRDFFVSYYLLRRHLIYQMDLYFRYIYVYYLRIVYDYLAYYILVYSRIYKMILVVSIFSFLVDLNLVRQGKVQDYKDQKPLKKRNIKTKKNRAYKQRLRRQNKSLLSNKIKVKIKC